MNKKIIKLTIPTRMFKILEKEREKYIYNSVQELILEAIREKYVRNRKKQGSSKRGRPKQGNDLDFLKRKKIFSTTGKPIDV
ncbi:MAG: hypothetical protein ABIG37_00720 [Nanoarchaeota archaeon]